MTEMLLHFNRVTSNDKLGKANCTRAN